MKENAPSRRYMTALSILVVLFLQAAATKAAYAIEVSDDGMEILTRGPVHEAFAEVSVDEYQPEVVIRRSVPEPINEIPPEYRPQGDNVQWIPGYWSWDEDLNDFIWVSGVWRDTPPGRQWVPGYWMTVVGGSQFVSGYWSDSNSNETVYLPPPPEPPQVAPGFPAFSADSIWIDGHWLWSGNRYAWQAGYWLRQEPERIWIPAHYVWNPRGYIFVPGYWDYQLIRRGVMFAPRYYLRPIYRANHYYYTPRTVLDIDAVFHSLYIRRDHRNYYFGDYNDVRYQRRGFVPWYSKNATRHGYDPYYKSYRWHQSRKDDQWERNYKQQFNYRRDHRETRPPVTYREQAEHYGSMSRGSDNHKNNRYLPQYIDKKNHDRGVTVVRPDLKNDYQKRDGRVINLKTERRAGEAVPQNKVKSSHDNDHSISLPRRSSAFPGQLMAEPAHFPGRQQIEQRGNQQLQTYQRPRNRPYDSQVEGRLQKARQAASDRPRADQNRRDMRRGAAPPDIQARIDQSPKFPQKTKYRTDNQMQRNNGKLQPSTASEGKNLQRQVKQQKSPNVTGSNQSLERAQVKQKERKQVDLAAQEKVDSKDGQWIMTPKKKGDLRPAEAK